jgi:hypothetical protein
MDLILWIGRHRWLTLSVIVLVIWFRSPHTVPLASPVPAAPAAAAYGASCPPSQGGAVSGGAVCRGFAARGYPAWTWQPA